MPDIKDMENMYGNKINADAKAELENYCTFHAGILQFFKGINGQIQAVLNSSTINPKSVELIQTQVNAVLPALSKLKFEISMLFDAAMLSEAYKAKINQTVNYAQNIMTIGEVDIISTQLFDLLKKNETAVINEQEERKRREQEEKERIAREEAERKAKEEQERKEREKAERKAKAEKERKEREERERIAREKAEKERREWEEKEEKVRREREEKVEKVRREREERERIAWGKAEHKDKLPKEFYHYFFKRNYYGVPLIFPMFKNIGNWGDDHFYLKDKISKYLNNLESTNITFDFSNPDSYNIAYGPFPNIIILPKVSQLKICNLTSLSFLDYLYNNVRFYEENGRAFIKNLKESDCYPIYNRDSQLGIDNISFESVRVIKQTPFLSLGTEYKFPIYNELILENLNILEFPKDLWNPKNHKPKVIIKNCCLYHAVNYYFKYYDSNSPFKLVLENISVYNK